MTFKERVLLAAAVRPAWQRYAATGLLLIIIISCWWFLSYRTLYAQLQERLSYANQQEPLVVTSQAGPEPQAPQSSFNLASQQFFVMPHMSAIVQKLVLSCQQHQLSIESYSVADRQVINWGFRTPIKLVMTGDFFNLLKFFEALQQATNMVFESCEMSVIGDVALRCACQLSVYTPTNLK